MASFKLNSCLKLCLSRLPHISKRCSIQSSTNPVQYSSCSTFPLQSIGYVSQVSNFSGLANQDVKESKLLSVTTQDDVIRVNWEDFGSVSYLTSWLRDNCTCPKCFHPVSEMRLQLMADLDINILPKKATIDGNALVIHWQDGHISTFPSKWLQERSPPQSNQIPKKSQWNGTFLSEIPKFEYTQLLKDDNHLLSCLQSLDEFGITILKGVPCKIDALKIFSKRAGFMKMTHYGDNFEVMTKPTPNNLAYTSSSLGLHLDLPYYNYIPGTQLLHCIQQHKGEGGDNQFVDGFSLAQKIRDLYPEEWKILTSVHVQFFDRGITDYGETEGETFNKIAHIPTINLGSHGQVTQVCYNNQARDSNQVGDLATTRDLYRSLKLFNDLAYSPELMVQLKMEDGDLVWFDNLRVMHGRTGFVVEEGQYGGRHLQGAYIDWDEIYSRINVLNKQIG